MNTKLATLLLTALLSGCTVGPDYTPPTSQLPEHWIESAGFRKTPGSSSEWWKKFNDPTLNRLIREAILNNLDLKQTYTRIVEAREQRTVAIAAGLPIVSTKTSVSRRLNNAGQSGSGGLPGGYGFGGYTDILQLGFDVSWEIDLFGSIRRSVEAAQASLEAEVENSRDILITLLGDVARYYIEMRRDQRLLEVTRENLRLQSETARLTRISVEAGLSHTLEAAQADALVAQTQATLPQYETQRKQAMYQIELLLGKQPGALKNLLESEQPMPVTPEYIAASLPSELLRRRPDIRKAERELAQTNANVGVAVADMYPKFNIAAFLGLQNTQLTDITALGKSWSAAGTLTTPVFNWGKIQANITAKEAQHDQALLSYQSTVLGALKEVESNLVAYAQEKQRCASLAQAVASNRLALALSQERYRSGLTSFLNVLDSERTLFSAESDWVASQAQVSSDMIAIYKALGGGWETALADSGDIARSNDTVNPLMIAPLR
ncbi:efflux transporter outer membrane subunit [Candidatus Methylospira mobilis]|uniref:efflux transporter outer membrane subunit n=1 Tax=Candidatus Methylospira mobilis TaxID=1808979 RepID=UPI001D17669D|nr:efflux transporter outer membrane subunit [Candidatus Methylospira mobilis]WNV06288.1 efflux transporter outer membrane subunit [Candidatus Methylospira mobilis]